MKGMRTSSQKRRASAARKTLAALLLSAIMCFYGVPVAAIGESVANASNAGTLEQAGGSIQDSLTLDAGKSSGTLFSSTHGTEYYNWVSSDPSIAVADIVESGKMADDGSSYTVLYKYSITAGLKGGTTTVKLVNKASGVTDAVYSVSVNPRTYVLTLDANGADAAAKTLKVTNGTTVSLSDYAVSRDGYTLVGWSANASADPTSAGVYKSTYEYAGVGNTTLYAIWSKNEATSPKAAENNQTDVQEPEDSAEYPAAELDSEADGVTVHVSAPAGALPEGVQLQTAAVYSGAVTYAIEQSANADGKEVSSLKAIDVTLTDKDDNEIQPNEKVVVTFGNTGVQGEQINVYHMDSEASAPEKIASNVSADPTVKAAHFSIYIVSGETTPAVATYQFLDAKGSVVSEQKVKDGETLYAPASPEKSGAKFMGWTLTKGGATADFTPGSASVSKTETITVYPVFVGAHYVQFMDDQGRVAVTKTVGTGETVSTADVTLPLPSTKGVTGWYSSKEAAQAQDAGKLVTEYTFANDSDPDIVLWPHIEEGHYVTFDAHGGSYTKPQFVLNGKSASEPNDPTRMGYEFIGWSTSATEWNPYNFHSSVNDAVTLHAWWEAQETTYTVVIWKQSVNDSKNASDAEKTYDFAESHSEKATSGSEVSPSWSDSHKDYTGFGLNSNLTDSDVEVKGDGTTVVNVYYDRQLRTINFWEYNWPWGWQVVDTMTGLYGQSLAQNGYTWQSEIKWSTEKTDGDSYGFIGYFLDSNSEKNLYNVGEWEGNHSYQFYTENLDGSWPSIPNNYIPDSGRTRWTFDESEGYVGFTLSEYSKDSGRTWKECQIGQTITADMNSCDVWIRHTRNSYTLSFYNYNTTSKKESVKYEQPLSSFESYVPSPPEGLDSAYQFQGWYKDDALTEKFDFASETMPAAGLTLYAKWAAPDQTATTHLSMAVSGSDTVSFDVAYGSKVDPAHMPTVKDSNGNVVSQGDDSLGVVMMPANTEWAGWATREDDCFVMFNFDSEIYSPIELYPYWISTDKYLVNYAANGGTGTVVDESSYDLSVQARVASGENLTAPVGKVFLGWSTSPDSTSAQYQPGDSITVSDLADASSRIATLYAVWGGTPATTSLTYRTNYPAETGLTDTSKESVANVENNYGGGATGHAAKSLVTATPEELGFTVPDEYYFTGWSDGTKTIAASESIGIDNLTANELTAQWCKKSELAITVTGLPAVKTYNGKEQSVSGYAATYALDGSVVTELPDGLTLNVSGDAASGTDVGTYETSMAGNVSISGSNAYKYKVTTSVSEGRLTIDKMAVKNVGESASRTYTGSEIELVGITWATVAEGQSISGLTYSAKGTAAGTYEGAFSGEAKIVDASGADVTSNYEITNTPGSLTIDRAAELTVHATGNSAAYTYDGTEKSVEGYTTDAPADVTVELAAGKSARAAGTEAGTYQMGLTSADFSASSPNYKSVAVEWADGSLTIDRAAELTVHATGNSAAYTYDGTEKSVEGYTTDAPADVTVELAAGKSARAAGTEAGTYQMGLTSADFSASSPNYKSVAVEWADGSLTIDRAAELTVHATGNSAAYTYDGTEKSVEGYTTDAPADVTVELAAGKSARAAGTEAGTYQMGLTSADFSASSPNYKSVAVEWADGSLTIDRAAELTVHATGNSAAYTYDGTEKSVEGYTTDAPADVTVELAAGKSARAAGTEAGTYQMGLTSADFSASSPNYKSVAVEWADGSLTIDRAAELTVHATGNSAAYTYDGTEKSVEGYTTDAPADVTVELAAGKSARAAGTEAGTYQMGLTSADFSASSPNYKSVAVEWADGSLTIGRAEGLMLSVVSYEGVYDGVSHAVSASPSVSDGTKVEWSTNGGATWAEDVPSAVDVVDLTIQVRATNPNYSNTATADTTLRIVPAELTVTTPSASKAFDGTALTKADGATCEGLANGETASFEVTGSRTEIGTSDNTYELTWNGTAKQSNYRVTENLGKLTITDPAVEITKSLDNTGSGVDGTFLAGDNAQFTITVTNVGEDTLHNVAVTDSLLPGWSETVASLAPGAGNAATFSVSYEVTQADVDSGGLANIAYADPEGPADPVPTDPVPVPTDETASVSISKTLDNEGSSPDGAFVAGDVAEFTITVVNDGAVTLHNVAVTDSLLPGWSETVASLAPGAGNAATFSVSYEVTQADVDSGGLANIAYADPEGPADPVPTDPVPVPTDETASVSISKTLDNEGSSPDGAFVAGDVAEFTITVVNDGAVTLHNVAVTDSLLPGWSETVASLAPGAGNAATFSVSYEVTQADVDSGGLANIAYADPEGPADPVPTDPVPVPTDETASVSISKTLDNEGSSPDGAFVAGDVAEFTITVVNDGAVTLHNVAVTDSLLPGWSETVASLAPGAGNAATFSVSYEVTQADVDSGGLANIAYADPEGPADPVPTDPVPVPTPEYADITITANDVSKLVGEEDPILTATISGLPAGVEGITYTVSRVAGEDVGTYQIVPAGDEYQLGSDDTLYRISYVPGVFTITGPDTPTPPTPPTPPAPTPPTPGTTVTVIPAPTTPTVTYIVAAPTPAAPADDGLVTVDENGTPTAPAEHVDCWVHWLIILGTLLASLYYIGVVIRRQKNINSLRAVAGKGKNV